jgi:hypothetical protein
MVRVHQVQLETILTDLGPLVAFALTKLVSSANMALTYAASASVKRLLPSGL